MAKAKTKRLNCGYGYLYVRITKTGEPRFYHEYYDAHGKRKQELDKAAKNWDEAAINLAEKVQRERDTKLEDKPNQKKIGFREFSQMYLQDYAMVAKNSWRTDKSRLKELMQFFGDVELRKITPFMIEKFRKSRLKIGNSKSTCNRYIALLKKMLNLAEEENFLERNPAKKIKLYSERNIFKERVLTKDEEKKLIETSSEHLKPILKIALYTGMRLGEILELQWTQVDFETRTIKVEKTKNDRIRHIPINNLLFQELMRLKNKNGQTNYMFFNSETGKPITTVKTGFNAACRRAGIEGLRFHDLRHTFASRLVAAGIDIETVRSLLGHSDIKMTMRYTHSSSERKREAVEVLTQDL
jgi:integrase